MFCSHGSNHSKGVTLLSFEIKRAIHDKSGKFLIMEARIEQNDTIFANIYAPNDNKNQINF